MPRKEIDEQTAGDPALAALIASLHERFGDSLGGVLFYGSMLRSGDRDETQLLDLVVIVRSYRGAYRGWALRLANAILPPNVFYLETLTAPDEGEPSTVRAKFAVFSLDDLEAYTASDCLQPWLWGRLAQPVALAWAADDACRQRIETAVEEAGATMLRAIAPLGQAGETLEEFWVRGLEASYRTEFRAESKRARAAAIVSSRMEHYRTLTNRHADRAGLRFDDEAPPSTEVIRAAPTGGGFRWFLRRLQGRLLQVLRLMKAAFTFDGGLDYLLWKIERHSGVHVEPSPLARRYPLIFGWTALWEARRRGGFR
jgi:hypothetical protein